MARYIDADECLDAMRDEMAGTGYQNRAMNVVKYAPTADVMSIEEVAELLGRVESIPCEVNGNEWLQEICEHKDACVSTSDKDCWLQYLKYRKTKVETEKGKK